MPELSEVETVRDDTQARRWGQAEWGPFALFACYTASFILWKMFFSGFRAGVFTVHWWDMAIEGALICLPFQYALWTAWSPHPPVWRIPLGISACIFQSITLSTMWDDAERMTFYTILFFVSFIAFTILRVLGGWHFFVSDERLISSTIAKGRQFSMQYLFVWMTLCALLLMLGRFALPQHHSIPVSIAILILAIAIFGLSWLPILGVGLLLLGKKWSVVLGMLALPIGIALSALIHYQGTQKMSTLIVGMLRVLPHESAFYSVGIASSMILTALVLRYSGYRITRDAKAAA